MPSGTLQRMITLRDYKTGDDDHFGIAGGYDDPVTVDGAIVEAQGGAAESGNAFKFNNNTSVPIIGSIKHVLVLPIANGAGTGSANLAVMVSSAGATMGNLRLTVDNNTVSASAGSPIFVTEQTSGGVGSVVSLRNNLLWRSNAGAGLIDDERVTAVDAGTFAAAGYNYSYNVTTPDLYESADAAFTGGPGVNDQTAIDPMFVDPTRNLATWGASIGGAATDTWDEIWTEIRKRNNDSGYNSAYDWRNAYTWIRLGWAPTNAQLKGAGYDGSDIGAMDYYNPIGGASFRRISSPLFW
jgi:hypothetical protein